jgi:hypothetical protein
MASASLESFQTSSAMMIHVDYPGHVLDPGDVLLHPRYETEGTAAVPALKFAIAGSHGL